jgi:flavodoxin short chain
MSKVLIVYWSGSGNTEKISELIERGASEKGASVIRKRVGDAQVAELAGYDVVAFGSPSMGVEVIEEAEMEPFFKEAIPLIKEKKIGIFGSYGWGDGEWLRLWAERIREAGGNLVDDGLAIRETPEGESEKKCLAWGEKLQELR